MKIAASHSNLLSQTVQLPGISQAAPAGKWGVTHWMDANKKAGILQGVCVCARACMFLQVARARARVCVEDPGTR